MQRFFDDKCVASVELGDGSPLRAACLVGKQLYAGSETGAIYVSCTFARIVNRKTAGDYTRSPKHLCHKSSINAE